MELLRALAVFTEPPTPEHARLASLLDLPSVPSSDEHTEMFLFQLYPYASVYLSEDGMIGGEARDRVAGFWRAMKRVPPGEPDHLAALLGLYAAIAEEETAEADAARRLLLQQSRKALLWEHLASWLGPYLGKAGEIASPCYRAWAALLRNAIFQEIGELGIQEVLPVHLRLAPALPDPREAGAEAFLRGLLAPVCSGILLVRADLARAARDIGVGLRLGGRRFVLETLLAEDPLETLRWLQAESEQWVVRHRVSVTALDQVADFWASKAQATAALVSELRSVERVTVP